MWSMMELLAVKKSLKLHRPTQVVEQANSRCRGLLYQVLPHSNQRRKKNDKVFFEKEWGAKQKTKSSDKGSHYSGWRNG